MLSAYTNYKVGKFQYKVFLFFKKKKKVKKKWIQTLLLLIAEGRN